MPEVKRAVREGDLPAIYQAWSARSDDAQRSVLRAVKASLGGAIAAALLGLFDVRVGDDVNIAALAASIGFLISLLASSWLLWKRPEGGWYDARAGAESIKTLAWQFSVAGGEFPRSEDEDEIQRRFLNRIGEILSTIGTLGTPVQAGNSQLTPRMLELRAAPLDVRQDAYLSGRIKDQRDWYASKAAWNDKRRKIWALLTLAVQALGLAAGLARAFFGLEVDLLGFAAALVAGITAWARTKDYTELTEAYSVTAQEIGLLADEPVPDNEDDWADFVDVAERAFSREHTLWRARKGHLPLG
jgi:hypothetical protein